MSAHSTLLPGNVAPDLSVPLVGGGNWSLAEQGDGFVLIDFYRGLHCPRCKLHIIDLKSKLDRFAERNVQVLAVSMDEQQRAEASYPDWGLDGLMLGFDLSEQQARAWGLYLTDAIGEHEPGRFSEPAIIVSHGRPRTVYSVVYGSNPLNRVHASDMLESFDAVIARDYPARGTVA